MRVKMNPNIFHYIPPLLALADYHHKLQQHKQFASLYHTINFNEE